MPLVTENEFLYSIKSNKVGELYFIFGEEVYLTELYTKKLEKKILGSDVNNFNYKKIDEFNFNLEEIVKFIDSLPFFSRKKVLKISNLKQEILNKNDLKKFKDILKNLPDYITVIIAQTSEEVNLKNAWWLNFYKFFQKYGNVLITNKLTKYNLEKVLEKWEKEKGIVLDFKLRDKLLEICPNYLMNLKEEFKKIEAYSLSKTLEPENLQNIVFHSKEANIFELTKAIANFDLKDALKKLEILLSNKEEHVFILNIISNFYLDVYRVKIFETYKKPLTELKTLFDYKNKEFKIDIAKRYCKNLTLKDIKEHMKLLATVDLKLKTTNLDKKLLLRKLLVRIILK